MFWAEVDSAVGNDDIYKMRNGRMGDLVVLNPLLYGKLTYLNATKYRPITINSREGLI